MFAMGKDRFSNAKPKLTSVHPQTASSGPGQRFRSFEILKIARYSSGFKIAQALPQTKIYHLWMDTNCKTFQIET